ncbi:MAG: heavy-metal-associated domain-containing protein [Planctomycetes bacterium]|nr:heavy-metal-associated domain-containing protein [Planctomycetota bacterium]
MRISTLVVLFALAVLAAPLAFACDKCGKPPSAETRKTGKDKDVVAAHEVARPKGKTYELSVPDMGCDNCVKVLREKLKAIEGIIEVEGDLDKKTLKVTVEQKKELKEEDAKKVIKGAGYTWGGIKERPEGKEIGTPAETPKEEPKKDGAKPAEREKAAK